MNIHEDIKAYEEMLTAELAIRTSDKNRITMLKYEIKTHSNIAPRKIINEMYALTAEKYMIDIDNRRTA